MKPPLSIFILLPSFSTIVSSTPTTCLEGHWCGTQWMGERGSFVAVMGLDMWCRRQRGGRTMALWKARWGLCGISWFSQLIHSSSSRISWNPFSSEPLKTTTHSHERDNLNPARPKRKCEIELDPGSERGWYG